MLVNADRFVSFARFGGARGAKALAGFASAALVLVVAPDAFARSQSACPANMAHIGNSCVDRWEASLVEIDANGSETPFSPYQAPNGRRVKAVSRPGVVPQAHISMVEAGRACKAAGKRLCHAKEWKNACKGPGKTRYPYGDRHVANACVDTGRTSPMRALRKGAYNHENMNDPRMNQLANTVEPTGRAASCTNDYEVFDMVGNVHEWLDDGAFHGGYYLDTKINNEGCDYKTSAHAPNYYDYSTGFRCCADEGTAPATPDDEAPAKPFDGVARVDTLRPAPAPHAALDGTLKGKGAPGGDGSRSFEASRLNEVADRDSLYPPSMG